MLRDQKCISTPSNVFSFVHSPLQCSCLTNISIIFYHNSTQHTSPKLNIIAVEEYSNCCRDGNLTTATHHNANAVKYERSLYDPITCLLCYIPWLIYHTSSYIFFSWWFSNVIYLDEQKKSYSCWQNSNEMQT